MYANYFYDEKLEADCVSALDETDALFQELSGILSQIDGLLAKSGWEGDAHTLCVNVQTLLSKYQVDMNKLLLETRTCLCDAISDANNFVDISEKVDSIRQV